MGRTEHLGPPVPTETPNGGKALSRAGTRAHTPGQETQPLAFLCLLRPACVFPHLKGALSAGSRADPLPLMLINIPRGHPVLPTPPPSSAPSDIKPGKGNLKIKPGPESVPLNWAPVLTDLLILAYLSPAIRLLTACYQPVGENVLQPD